MIWHAHSLSFTYTRHKQRKRKAKAAKKRQQQTQQQLSLPRAPRPVGMIDDESSGSESEEEGMQERCAVLRLQSACIYVGIAACH